MTPSPVRTRPLVAVLSRVPLFVEGVSSVFEGIADVAVVATEAHLAAPLLRAYHPDAVVVEGYPVHLVDEAVPCVQVDLATDRVDVRVDGTWTDCGVELAPETIRNLVVATVYGGAPV